MKHPTPLPSLAIVSALYDYDPETGLFTRRRTFSKKAVAGQVSGTLDGKGYLKLSCNGRQYFAHRLAWLFVHGHVPPVMIDHINGNGLDNRISNLRLATRSENAWNQRRAQSGSRTGVLGVYCDSRCKKTPYYSKIVVNGQAINLGYFATLEAASVAYTSAKKRLHVHQGLGIRAS